MIGRALLAVVVLAAVAAAGLHAPASARAAVRCPSTFTVLHDDRVGALAIPQGPYRLVVDRISCGTASLLLGRFLDDFDGLLPGGWTVDAARDRFVNAATGATLALRRATGSGAGGRCPGTFTVVRRDRIGTLALRAGRYRIAVRGLSCATAASRFAFFLFHDFAGRLPSGWRLDAALQRFSSGRRSFTVAYVDRRGRSGGGGVHPGLAITCPGTVSVARGTTIAGLVVPAGRYYVNVFSNLPCRPATRDFERFAAAGALPAPWTLQPATGTFLRGREGFQIEPAS